MRREKSQNQEAATSPNDENAPSSVKSSKDGKKKSASLPRDLKVSYKYVVSYP